MLLTDFGVGFQTVFLLKTSQKATKVKEKGKMTFDKLLNDEARGCVMVYIQSFL